MNEKELLDLQIKVLGHEGYGFTEFRNIGLNKFVSINPRKTKDGTKNEDVSYLTTICIDIDPVRPKDTPSTEEQHFGALRLGSKVVSDLPSSILVDSGSGCHVYLPIRAVPISNPTVFSTQIEKFYEEIRGKYGNKDFKIDNIQDLARVIRVWGSWNPKSNRQCIPLGIEDIKEFSRFDFTPYLKDLTKTQNSAIIIETKTAEEERFEQLCTTHPGIKRMMQGEGDYPSRSESDYAFIAYLTKAHFSLDDIKRLAKRNPTGRGIELLDKDTERIVRKVESDNSGSKSLIHSTTIYSTNLANRKPGYNTGFTRLDQMLAGLQKGKLYVIAARTNEGKTSFAVQIAANLAIAGITTLYFPTELGYEPLFDKIFAVSSNVDLRKFQQGDFSSEENGRIQESIIQLKSSPFIVHEDFALTLEKVRNESLKICPGVIIIDYLQAFKFINSDSGKQAGEIANIMRGLKQLNEELNVPIIVCSQFSRGAINAEVSVAHLKGSGAIEEFSDVVIALSTLSKFEYPRPVDLYVLKSRYSEIGKIRLDFYSSIGKFKEKESK